MIIPGWPAGPAMDLRPVLVLGLGNDILTDDAVGLRVVDRLRELLAPDADSAIELQATTEMGLALLDEIAGRAGLVLVDAVQTGAFPPGHIQEMQPHDFAGPLATAPHFLGLRETLALGRLLGLPMPGRTHLVAIEVADPYTLGTKLTPAVAAAVPLAAARAATLARELAATLPPLPAA